MTDRVRNPTILDVARLAGVSKSVVSRVLTGRGSVGAPARRRVLDAASELGYVVNAVARAMAAHRTHTLGVFVRDAATPFYGHLLTAMQERASHHGYRVVTATGSGKFEVAAECRALETLVMLQVEGLVVCSGLLPAHDVVPFAERIPTIVAGRPETHASITSVFCDEDEGGARLAEHVVGLGHRTVAVVRLDADQSLTMAPRTAAMARRLRELGAAVVEMAGGQVDELASVAQALGEAPAVTAVMAPSDIHAPDGAARRGGRRRPGPDVGHRLRRDRGAAYVADRADHLAAADRPARCVRRRRGGPAARRPPCAAAPSGASGRAGPGPDRGVAGRGAFIGRLPRMRSWFASIVERSQHDWERSTEQAR
jgi:DNA-binding LacI/PurR family transcriptional regulator